jgi:hypothetical protein
MTCCNTNDRFSPVKNRSDWLAKNPLASSSAIHGPKAAQGTVAQGVLLMLVMVLALLVNECRLAN